MLPPESLDSFIDASARILDLAVAPEWKGAVRANLEVSLQMAALLASFPLPDDAEPAPIFQA